MTESKDERDSREASEFLQLAGGTAAKVSLEYIGGHLAIPQLRLTPEAIGAAQINLLMLDGVIFSAGQGTRYELDPWPEARDDLRWLVAAVVQGHLVERVRRKTCKWRLTDADGKVHKGGQWGLGGAGWGRTWTTIRYTPY